MQLLIQTDGSVRCVYGEAIDLTAIGRLSISRASHVEPGPDGRWWTDLSPVNGPVLGPFVLRTAALQAEQDWLAANWLQRAG